MHLLRRRDIARFDLHVFQGVFQTVECLVEEFLRAVSVHGGMNLHVDVLAGRDAHHMAEGIFKSLARALDAATSIDPRVKGVPSTKGVL